MPTSNPHIKVYMEYEYKKKIEYIAKKNNRSASNYFNDIALQLIEQYEREYGAININDD